MSRAYRAGDIDEHGSGDSMTRSKSVPQYLVIISFIYLTIDLAALNTFSNCFSPILQEAVSKHIVRFTKSIMQIPVLVNDASRLTKKFDIANSTHLPNRIKFPLVYISSLKAFSLRIAKSSSKLKLILEI